ncbi:MAG: transcription-repair coupling factor [Lentisphaerae bacterium RIFOXYC12_FULL_60_16]|nr:MAG: transcription-repair coupling factor [Lentisphaerae bacterium RIFOXYC12_FULL_60_16]OGV86138.1 MAG: transcription-repair coupling factor [Lentisphaerae bacterium RIFOXYB12_FULL_60_10]
MSETQGFSTLLHACTTLLTPLDKRNPVCFPRLPGPAEALITLAAIKSFKRSMLWIGDSVPSLERFHRDLTVIGTDINTLPKPLYFPPLETMASDDDPVDPRIAGPRLQTLLTLLMEPTAQHLIVTSIQAMIQPVPRPETLTSGIRTLQLEQILALSGWLDEILQLGYDFQPDVILPGQACHRGGVVDLWPLPDLQPLRIEFDGDRIASLRRFAPETQMTTARETSAVIPPATAGTPGLPDMPDTVCLLDYIQPALTVAWHDRDSGIEHAMNFRSSMHETNPAISLFTPDDLDSRIARLPDLQTWSTGCPDMAVTCDWGFRLLPGLSEVNRSDLPPVVMDQARQRLARHLDERRSTGYHILACLPSRTAWETMIPYQAAGSDSIPIHTATLSEGFECTALQYLLITESDIYGRRRSLDNRYDPVRSSSRPTAPTTVRFDNVDDLKPGDWVVHVHHGVGQYKGLSEIVFDGCRQEVITVEYAEHALLHVPVSHAHLLSRYLGVGKASVTPHRIGGRRWKVEKQDAERAIMDMAGSLLETQAKRESLDGFAFQPDTPWQHEFESAFPFVETPDQTNAIAAVKADMESHRPMDRLLCGDAGYGKTEVAMRAAFKAVSGGKQVAVLVPTTVLAQQHLDTFRERMAAYPIRIEMLSRFSSRSARPAVLQDVKSGRVDILIGTHALLQPDIHFHDLGLAIIDEEQRFGVAHKERLKQLRYRVDILTLTATPIPRTLYLSMTGTRDISLLQTPPRDRLAIETVVTRDTDKIIREAILRERNRDGQIFYLHNRVRTIDWTHRRLATLVPEARIAVAHGQMAAGALADIMHRFVNGEFDILLSTTIIESGMDIPRVNTILVDRADRFGIADLYQLRGRVGRSRHQAYAYLLLPTHGHIEAIAEERLAALRRYGDLGMGFNLALRDLEIRGAGNLLGAEQSGHIAAIGFSLYCQLLRRSIALLRHEPAPPIVDTEIRLDGMDLSTGADPAHGAVIPIAYIDNEQHRVRIYRKLAEAASPSDIRTITRSLQDRFGPIPPPLKRLLRIAALRILATSRKIQRIEVRNTRLQITRKHELFQENNRFPRLRNEDPDGQLREITAFIRRLPDD